jgi:hypothetical protein
VIVGLADAPVPFDTVIVPDVPVMVLAANAPAVPVSARMPGVVVVMPMAAEVNTGPSPVPPEWS